MRIYNANMCFRLKKVSTVVLHTYVNLLSYITCTKYVHIKSTTVYAPRRNWDSPNPFLASECSPPPRNRGRGHTSQGVGGWGESQFRRGAYTVVLFICTYFVITCNLMVIKIQR